MKKILIVFLLFAFTKVAFAGEGMWLPLLLKSLNESEMQSMGMKLSAEDVYSVNNGSLKDAIVHFGGFCTSEIISSQGLLLTNHHCGYGQIQSHSSVDNNLLKNGFWAKSMKEELSNPGLTATLIDRIEDVTEAILSGVTGDMINSDRQSQIDKNINALVDSLSKESYQEVAVRPFYNGNQFFAFVTTTYKDIRLVGAPPESIGKFGSDTDNWVWPRHTGDFSLFRIYAGPDNLPAEYSAENKPYTPKHHLPISLDGVEEGDFTMVFGFPGRTNQYLPAIAVKQIVNDHNPAKIKIREKALSILDKYMREDESVKIKYASKFASIANYWKKWIGEKQGLEKTNAIAKKEAYEKAFEENTDPQYADLLPQINVKYISLKPHALARDYYNEIAGRNVELLRVSGVVNRLVDAYKKNGKNGYEAFKERVVPFLDRTYKNLLPSIDQEVFASLAKIYKDDNFARNVPPEFADLNTEEDFTEYADAVFTGSILSDYDSLMGLLHKDPMETIAALKMDPLLMLARSWKDVYDEKIARPYNNLKGELDVMQRYYMQAQIETFPDRRFYPDANGTMRISYGQVANYSPRDAVTYNPVSYLGGVMEKYVPDDYEFDVSKKLRSLYQAKDYGDYADDNGKMPVCFIGSNHTTGGNSGSPAIDGEGNLIGLNFDRAWEGTMSDINYDKSICRNIMVDARYILFIIDKYADAGHLIEEMTLVHPKE